MPTDTDRLQALFDAVSSDGFTDIVRDELLTVSRIVRCRVAIVTPARRATWRSPA